MDHLLHSFHIVLAEVNDTGVGLAELIAASAVEEAAPRAKDGLVNRPLTVVASDSKVRVFAAKVQSATSVSTSAHDGCNKSFDDETTDRKGKILTSIKHSSTRFADYCSAVRKPLRTEAARTQFDGGGEPKVQDASVCWSFRRAFGIRRRHRAVVMDVGAGLGESNIAGS